MRENEVSILGGGLVGSLLSAMLAKEGFEVDVYEKRNDPRQKILDQGRSINLALSHRGIRSLQLADAFDKVKPYVIPMKGRMIHDQTGSQNYQSYGKEDQYINSISRATLNQLLIEHSEACGSHFHFNKKCTNIDLGKNSLTFEKESENLSSKVLIGADGAFSQLRQSMQRTGNFSFSQSTLKHGYKELNMPPKNGDFALAPNYLHIWPRKSFMLIALPNIDKTFTCTLFLSFKGKESFEKLQSDESILEFFEREFKGVTELIPDLIHQFQSNPSSYLVTIKTNPWAKGRAMLIGDASHAIVPFYGQGMNAGFEDCRLFMEMGKEINFDWDQLLPLFSNTRKKDVDAISDLAMHNFVEMRDRVVDEAFLKQKKLEARLQASFPNTWTPLYSMVTFSDTPYSTALAHGKIQEEIIRRLPADYDPETEPLQKIIDEFSDLTQGAQRE